MANDKDLVRIRQGPRVWNAWRADIVEPYGDLSQANLRGADLTATNLKWAQLAGANLEKANLTGATLEGANLKGANLKKATLYRVDLNLANLHQANLNGADIEDVSFTKADLSYAQLEGANLKRTKLSQADLSFASLIETDLSFAGFHQAYLFRTNLYEADFSHASLLHTTFIDVDLSKTQGLESCLHLAPSVIDYYTLQRSGRLPLAFLRGCGLSDRLIDYLPSLLEEAIQYYSCFISYSSKDEAFVKRLHADLQNTGVRCWFAPHDLPIGAKTWDAIDAAIRVRDKVLLILSKKAIASDWVEDEVNKAFAEEKRRKQIVLFPVRIDETVMKTDEPWAVKLRDNRNIGDFRKWKDDDAYQEAFNRVLRDLMAAPG